MKLRRLHFDWNWQLTSSAEELWPLVSDIDRLNRNLNLPPVQISDLSYEHKEGRTQLAYNGLQYNDAWIEEPYEWERPYRYGVKRYFKSGSYHEMEIQVDLIPNDHGTRVRYQQWSTTKNLLLYYLKPIKARFLLKRNLGKALKRFDRLTQQHKLPYQLNSSKHLDRGGQKRLDQLKSELFSRTGKPGIVTTLVELVTYAPDDDVEHISPYELADHLELPRNDVLSVFLHATKVGLLNFNWDLSCPRCRTVQHRCKTLNEIHEPVFCSSCLQEFFVNFNSNVKLSFRPNPLVRKISDDRHSLTGPQTQPHIVARQYVKPGQKNYLKINLEPGDYTLWVDGLKGEASFTVDDLERENITVKLTDHGLNGERVKVTNNPNLVFQNSTNNSRIFILEKNAPENTVLTAARVTSLQLFRDLFDNEVLRKGEKIAVDNQTLMFTDLFDSTGMYNKEGDVNAVGTVIEHFNVLQEAITEEKGAIVKTIGDSVMAVFNNPTDAFQAFRKAHEVISNDAHLNSFLKLKAGIHHGNCVAVNLNNNIDYFGSTVNIASRLVDYADEDEVVLTKSASRKLEQHDQTGDQYLEKDLSVNLRGFDNEQFQIKRITLETPTLRLVV